MLQIFRAQKNFPGTVGAQVARSNQGMAWGVQMGGGGGWGQASQVSTPPPPPHAVCLGLLMRFVPGPFSSQ